jgi:DNA invertase Pin-like site-specific DNA recombinase
MKVLYVRVSAIDQKTDRQTINEKDFNFIVEDKCSGAIPFFEREGGKKILDLMKKKSITSLSVLSIDRLGRNLKDILNTIELFTERSVPIIFINQGLTTLVGEGKENNVCTLIINILASVAQMERSQIKERQLEGIAIAKANGAYLGRKKGTEENAFKFLSKADNKKALEYIKKGYKLSDVAKIADLHPNTVTKVKKLGLELKLL